MDVKFTAVEIRVLGCLIEKASTTPESYPLTLNSLTRAANQKSSREPVMELTEVEVQEALDKLVSLRLVSSRSGSESRVLKYSHRLCDRRTPEFDFEPAELAVISALLLRGPQTPAEIRMRSTRVYQFEDVQSVEATLKKLAGRSDGPYVRLLARQSGQKEARYAHLFAGEISEAAPPPAPVQAGSSANRHGQPDSELGQRLEQLESEVAALRTKLDNFIRQFD